MSVETRTGRLPTAGVEMSPARAAALGATGLLSASYLTVFYRIIDITGDPTVFLIVTAATLGAAAVRSRSLRVRTAVLTGFGLLAVGLTLYLISLPRWPPVAPLIADAIGLATGRTLLQVTNVDIWVLSVSPAPVFLTWYFALRRRYVLSTLAGGAALGFLILTGDAGGPTALLGVVGGLAAIGVGDVDRRGDSLSAAEPLAILLAATVLLAGVVSVVPTGSSQTFNGWGGSSGGGGAETVEASVIDADDRLVMQGNISLSPTLRFRVQSDEPSYWRVGSYDRYTSDGWIRTGGSERYRGRLDDPPGRSQTIRQEYTTLDEAGVIPAAWRPVSVSDDIADRTSVTDEGGLELSGTLAPGQRFSVRSRSPVTTTQELRRAGQDYPATVEQRYTQLPSSLPDRVGERTRRITAEADNPYDTARVIERWLQQEKSYSLDIERPRGDMADAFLFEMDEGYCTYFATTMVAMLRTQGVPARMVSGYTTGERVSEDEWVVRGFNAHAWVEVYFPDVGWIRFDPTPSEPHEATRERELQQARAANVSNVDTDRTENPEWTPTPTPTPVPLTPVAEGSSGLQRIVTPTPYAPESNASTPETVETPTIGEGDSGGDGSDPLADVRWPTREEMTLGAIALFGLAIGLRRLGVFARVYRAIWLRYQPAADPGTDVERAFERLEYLLEQRYRARRSGETVRQYLAAIGADERARQVAIARERARYAGEITREEADEAIALVDELVSDG